MTSVNCETPSGLYYYDQAVSNDLSNSVEEWFNSPSTQSMLFPVTNKQGKSGDNARKVIHFGSSYGYTNSSVGGDAPPLPEILKSLRELIPTVWDEASNRVEGLRDNLDLRFNQCIVNRYLPGQGINQHIDLKKYGNTIVCFTFSSNSDERIKSLREMEFHKGANKFTIKTSRSSMYVMIGESRYEWKHLMRPRKSDIIEGVRVKRGECFSVTFRELK